MDLDLFSGARGWEAAAPDLGVDALGMELNADACATSRAAGFRTLEADIAAHDPLDFGPVRALIGGPPCQTFSPAGAGAGRRALDTVLAAVRAIAAGTWPADLIAATGDPRTGLVLQPLRYALALEPDCLAWEQVVTVLPVWDAMAEVLRARRYSVATGVLNAEQYGVPQTRRRAVLIARRDGQAALPLPTHSRYYSRDPGRLDPGVLPWVSMAAALGWAEDVEVVSNYGTGGDSTNRGTRASTMPSATVTSKADRMKVRRVGDPTTARPLTLAEAAALQTFPAGYPFAGSKGAQGLQIGNAVPPLLGRAILAAAMA